MNLMPFSLKDTKAPYFRENGREVPGVTTITRATMNKEGLWKWYHGLGASGVPWPIPEEHFGTELGKLIHARCQAWLKGFDGLDYDNPELMEVSAFPFARFQERWASSGLKVIASETPMVSEAHECGGTPDLVAERDGKLGVIDLKSSNPYPKDIPYPEIIVQLGAYTLLWNELHPGEPVTWCECWRLGKSKSDPGSVHPVRNLALAQRAAATRIRAYYELRDLC